jgi:3-hydroxyacyl-[acyl-carrier-protein] dehydratase
MRYLLIDRVLDFECDRRVVALKNVTLESDVMADHFPGWPLFPGALALESMAQAAGYLLVRSVQSTTGEIVAAVLSSVERAHFCRPVRPGDQLRITVEFTERTPNAARFLARTEVDGRGASRARLLLAHRTIDPTLHPDLVRAASHLFRGLERMEGPL